MVTVYKLKVINNKCPTCDNRIDRKGYYCSDCCNRLKILNRIRAKERRLAGLCVQCGNKVQKYIYCQVCRDARMTRYWAKKNQG